MLLMRSKMAEVDAIRPILLVKKRDQKKTLNTDVTIADPDFVFPTLAKKRYAYEGRFFFTTGAAEDFKYAFSIVGAAGLVGNTPQGCVQWRRPAGGTLTEGEGQGSSFGGTITVLGGAGSGWVFVRGWVFARQSGYVFFAWAQNTSGATPTILRAGSYIELTEVP